MPSKSKDVEGIIIPGSSSPKYILAETLNPGTICGISSVGFTSTWSTFSEVFLETCETLEIFVIIPGYDIFFQKLQVL